MAKKRHDRPKLASTLAAIDARIDADELLSDDDKATIRERARKHVFDKRKDAAMEEFLAAAIKDEERVHTRAEQFEDFMVDLPGHSYVIKLDNVGFFHGVMYEVTYSVARTLADVQARAWEHQNEIDGRRRRGDLTMQPRNAHISPSMQDMPASAINRSALARV